MAPRPAKGRTGHALNPDGFGRRRSKTVGGTTTRFLYDGMNPVQELASGTPTANLLTGLGIDEYFTRTDASGTANYLTDALGSSVALANGSGTIVTEYTYEPFGATSVSGASTGNPFGFTGREADGTGLHYCRARYYDARLQRFITEDPLGFDAGDVNLHAYVSNSPTLWSDPTGLIILYYKPFWDPCNPGSGKNPPAWVAFLCRPDVQLGIDIIIAMASGAGGGRPRGLRPSARPPVTRPAARPQAPRPATRPTSPNQMERQIKTGQAPKGVTHANQPRVANEKPHVHLDDGRALNQDGTWKHGSGGVSNEIRDWLLRNGWTPPTGGGAQ